jgi:hypothetical protein
LPAPFPLPSLKDAELLALLFDGLDFLLCCLGRHDEVDTVRPRGSTTLEEWSANIRDERAVVSLAIAKITVTGHRFLLPVT